MGLFDVHAHLTSAKFAGEADEVVKRAEAAGVTTIISNGLNPADNMETAALAARHDIVKPAFGLYPVDAVSEGMVAMGVELPGGEPVNGPEAVAWVEEHISEAVAVGEVGLDRYWVPAELWEEQEVLFRRLVQLALDVDKPLIIHTRKAEKRAYEVLDEMGAKRVNWHCYSSKVKLGARIGKELGHWLSLPANIARNENFKRLADLVPRNRILLETDCPYLSPERGVRNEPSNVAVTLAFLADRWEISEEAALDQLEANFEELFGFPA